MVEWMSVLKGFGEQYVMMAGIFMMQVQCVDNCNFQVKYYCIVILL